MAEVSVIIPVYNNERFVERCVRSVMGQTFQDLEIWVINDGSTDRSGQILENLAEEDSRIHLLTQKNRGTSAARNAGLDRASGTYLTFVDGDDYISKQYIQQLYDYASSHGTEMLICGFTFADEKGRCQSRVIPGEYRRFEKEEWSLRISAVCSHFYKKELWDRYHVRFRPGERGEDMPISLFFSAVCDKIATIPYAGYFYVQHGDSATHNFKGLEKYTLPYKALEDTVRRVQAVGIVNSPEFYELFVLRILAVCLFQLSPGASRDKLKGLCSYVVRLLETYFPNYYKNSKARLTAQAEIPLFQKAAVKVLILLVRTRGIYLLPRLLGR